MEISAALQAGKFTSRALVAYYLDRIDRYDEEYRAILAINPNAVNDAIKADQMRSQGSRAPLLGIPVLIKDNIETREPQPPQAPLRSGGIEQIVMRRSSLNCGKLARSSWGRLTSANGPTFDPSGLPRLEHSGWSDKKPYDPLRTPCGSSSGSGAAIAARFAPLAIGTETNGSIVCPVTCKDWSGLNPLLGSCRRHTLFLSRRLKIPPAPWRSMLTQPANCLWRSRTNRR